MTVRLPRGRLVCITGLSGSGKSSLAFDTLYAEGQRRYVESLSAYARQFLGQMDKPDVDGDRGPVAGHLDRPEDDVAQPALDRRHRHRGARLPAPAVRAHRAARTARSAAGRSPASRRSRSSTRCWRCPRARASRSTRRSCAAARASTATCSRALRGEGFTRARVDGETYLLEERPALDKKFKHDIAAVVDRLVIKDDLRRAADRLGRDGPAHRRRPRRGPREVDGARRTSSPSSFACPEHGVSLAELAPRMFSFNSPHGACPALHRPRLDARGRSRAGRARSRAVDPRGRAGALERGRLELLRAGAARPSPTARRSPLDDALGRARRASTRTCT